MSEKSPFKNSQFRPGRHHPKPKKAPELAMPSLKEINRNRRKGRRGYTFMGGQI